MRLNVSEGFTIACDLPHIMREKQNIQDLADELEYKSPQLTYLLSIIPDNQEKTETFIEAMRNEEEMDEVKLRFKKIVWDAKGRYNPT